MNAVRAADGKGVIRKRVVVIGVGNRMRHDDGVGPVVAERAARDLPEGASVHESDAIAEQLIDIWTGADTVVLVEALRGGAAAGSVHCRDVTRGVDDVPARSGHAHAIAEAITLGRERGLLPRRMTLVEVEPGDLSEGEGLSPAVSVAARAAAAMVVQIVRSLLEVSPAPS